MSDSTQNPPQNPHPEGSAPPPPPTTEGPTAPPGGSGYGQQQPPPAYGGQPGYGAAPSGVGQPADVLNRFLARLIDFVLLFAVNMVLALVLFAALFGSDVTGLGMGMGGGFVAGAVIAVVQTAIYVGYFALMESRNGQTLGKMALKLQAQSPDGGTPSLEQAIRRNIFMAYPIVGVIPFVGWLGGIAALVGMILIAVNISQSPTRQGWHDTFAGGTKVIKIG